MVSLALLVHLTTLRCVWALRVAVGIHLACSVLLSAIDGLLLWRILSTSSRGSRSVADRRQLGTTHGRRHHVLRRVLGRALGRSAVLLTRGVLLALSLIFLLASVVFLLLLLLPFLADLLEFCVFETSRLAQFISRGGVLQDNMH